MSSETAPKKWPVSKGDPAFTKRLKTAIQQSPRKPPEEHGSRSWLHRELLGLGIDISVQSVAKWFAGRSRPRPSVMREVARILRVDEAWLSLGSSPDLRINPPSKNKNSENGPINLVSGLLQIAGGEIATSAVRPGDQSSDIVAIMNGRLIEVEVKSVAHGNERHRVYVSNDYEQHVILIVSCFKNSIQPTVFRLSGDLVDRFGKKKGGFIEVPISHNGHKIKVGDQELFPVRSLEDFGIAEAADARDAALKAMDLR